MDPQTKSDTKMPEHPTPTPTPASPQTPESTFYHAEDEAPAPQGPAPTPNMYQPADNPDVDGLQQPSTTDNISWTASEFIAHEKNTLWYVYLAIATLVVALIVFFITRDTFSLFIVAVAGILFGVVASRPPRQMQYAVSNQGITIGAKSYPYQDFRSFSVFEDGPFKSITFMPLKRLMPPLSIYYDPADEDSIATLLMAHLPMEEHRHDPLEKLMRRIRF